jgi:hypothetical protein
LGIGSIAVSGIGKAPRCAMPGSPARKPQGLTGSDIPSS